jgi:bacillithiol biosynthesis cysteine-adding enzyme BshC
MRTQGIQFKPAHPMVADYMKSSPSVRPFYRYDPYKESSFRVRAERILSRSRSVSRQALVDVLRAYHRDEETHPAVERNWKRLTDPDSLVVIGGQQAGLLTGPLYTIYKAVTLIQLARREEARLGRPVIPVFWIAGEDHDLNEVDHITLPSGDQHQPIHRHRLHVSVEGRPSVGRIEIEGTILQEWLDQLSRLLPDTEHKREVLSRLRQLGGNRVNWSRYFARLMHELFGRWGLLLVDSADPGLRRLEVPLFEELIRDREGLAVTAWRQKEAVEAAGYPSQVDVNSNQAHLFLNLDGRNREALYLENGQFVTKDGAHRWTAEALLDIACTHPERLSNNVITRPLMQEFLFPTLAVVLGPGEIAYWGLLKPLFERYGMEMPPLVPRRHYTLVDRATAKYLSRFSLTWDDVVDHLEEKKRAWLLAQQTVDVKSLFAQAQSAIDRIYEPLIAEIGSVEKGLVALGEKNREKVHEQIQYLKKKTIRAIERRHAVDLRQWDHLGRMLLPGGKWQERVYNIVYFWNQYGLEWLEWLVEQPLPAADRHWLVYL